MTTESTPPGTGESELTLFGPGYGESIALHIGDGVWIVVDSCIDDEKEPRALRYLEGLGLDPARAVALIVATRWHDDHIRGMAAVPGTATKRSGSVSARTTAHFTALFPMPGLRAWPAPCTVTSRRHAPTRPATGSRCSTGGTASTGTNSSSTNSCTISAWRGPAPRRQHGVTLPCPS